MSILTTPPAADFRTWERFQSGKFSKHEIARSSMLRRWQRCRDAGLSGENPGEPVMQLAGLAQAIENFAPLLAPGAPFDAFATEMARAGYCGLFCDAHGVILAQRIAEPFRHESVQTRLVEGAVWSESARGTNGVGTALAEGAALSIIGAEHFEYRNHCLACYAAPIRDIRRRVVAVLDASGPVSSASSFVQASVVATAAALEALIVARTYDAAVPGGLFELERLLARLPYATLLVESTGHVRRANARYHGIPSERRGSDVAALVRAQFAAQGSRGSLQPEPPEAWRGFSIEFEPIGLPEDPFAAVLHLRPRGPRSLTARGEAPRPAAFAAVLGSDPALDAARSRAERFARTDLPVLLVGETGAGKETFARAIHAASARAAAPFVAVPCANWGGAPIEGEMFGDGPGATAGRLADARGGTLFLDEVGRLSLPAQSVLMRLLDDGARADVRLIAASEHDLTALIAQGRFRSDLYFRLRGAVLRLPPLRERSDRRELALALLERVARERALPKPLGFSRDALEWIEQHAWPGNVRELVSALEYAVALAGEAPRIELDHLPADGAGDAAAAGDLRAAAERSAVVRALEQARGNLSDAARSLGVARSTLYRMLARHGLRADESGAPPPAAG